MSKIKKKKVISVSKLHELVWYECKRIIRNRYDWKCYTCGVSTGSKNNTHTSHGLSKGSLSLRFKYDLRNLKICCMRCNVHEQGNQEIFIARLQKEKDGLAFLKEAGYKDENGAWRCKKEEPIQARYYLEELLAKYKLL